jgi:hypothetical protein
MSADGADAWKDRWSVDITCRDCGASWECTGVSTSLDQCFGFNRMFVAGGPEVCPKCKNLKLAPPAQADSTKGDAK